MTSKVENTMRTRQGEHQVGAEGKVGFKLGLHQVLHEVACFLLTEPFNM